jgi:hypothetical protein
MQIYKEGMRLQAYTVLFKKLCNTREEMKDKKIKTAIREKKRFYITKFDGEKIKRLDNKRKYR